MSVTAPIPPEHVYYLKASDDTPVWYTLFDGIMDPVKTLIDSGSSRNFINSVFVFKHKLDTTTLRNPCAVIGIDGQEVENRITAFCNITFSIEGRTFTRRFYIMPLGNTDAILGMTWL